MTLIASSTEDYEALALRLALDPVLLAGVRARLARSRQTGPLFDTARFARGLEAAYARKCGKSGRPAESHEASPSSQERSDLI